MTRTLARVLSAARNSDVLLPIAVYALIGLAQRGVWVLMLPVYLALLAPEQFGTLVLVTFAASILAVVANLKLDAAMRTFYFDFEDDERGRQHYLRQVLTASVAFALLCYGVFLLLGESLFGVLFEHAELRFYPEGALALATAFTNACLASYLVYLRNALRLRELVWLQALLVVGNISLQIVFVVVLKLGVLGALLGAFVPAVAALAYVLAARTGLAIAELRWQSLGPSLRYSTPLIVFALFYVLESRLDAIVLEHFVDLAVVGGYAVLISILGLLPLALNALDNAMRPYLFPALKRNDAASQREVARLERIYVVAGLLALSLALLLAASMGLLTDNPAYLSIQGWLPLAATAFVPEIVTRFHSLYYDFHKRSAEVTAWIIIRTILMFALLIVIVPKYGIAGALVAVLLSQLANAVAFATLSRRHFAIEVPLLAAVLLIAGFLLITWLAAYLFGDVSVGLFGAVQFAVLIAFLFVANRSLMTR